MALAFIVDSLDSVPEGMRSEYTAHEGKFRLAVDGLEDTSGLKSALKKERDAAAKATKTANELDAKVKRWEALGKSEDEITAMVTAAAAAETEAAKKSGNFDALLKQHQDKAAEILRQTQATAASEKKTLETELNAARASERNAIIETSVTSALTKAKATTEGLDLLTERLGKRINFAMEDGKRVIQILQADGKTPMAGSGTDGTATYDDLIKEAVKSWPSLFEGTGAGGGGKSPTEKAAGRGDKTIPRAEWDKLNPFEQAGKVKAGVRPVD